MNARVAKRKNNVNINEVKIEPPKKALKKNEILAEYTALQKRFEHLQNKNKVLLANQKTNLEAINLLEETIAELEKKRVVSNMENKNLISTSVQTDVIRCEECEYQADGINYLIDHMHGNHSLEDCEDFDHSFKCEHCGKGFHEIKDLMMHIQKDQVKLCKESENINCTDCECTFNGKSALTRHRKTEPEKRVQS